MPVVKWAVRSRLHPRLNETTLIVARALCRYIDHDDGTDIRPGHARLVGDTGLSLPSIRRHLRWLREANLLNHVARGTRCPGGVHLAAEYSAVIPAAWDEEQLARLEAECADIEPLSDAPPVHRPAQPVDNPARPSASKTGSENRATADLPGTSEGSEEEMDDSCTDTPPPPVVKFSTDTEVEIELNRAGTRARAAHEEPAKSAPGRGSDPASDRKTAQRPSERRKGRRSAPVPGTRRWRRWELARQVRARVLLVARERVGRLASALREIADLGWTVDDVIAWLTLSPLPALVLFPISWLKTRLAGAAVLWPEPPSRRLAQERAAADEARLREQREFRARIAAEREAAVATEDRTADFGPVRARIRELASPWVAAAAVARERGTGRPARSRWKVVTHVSSHVPSEDYWREPEEVFLATLPKEPAAPSGSTADAVYRAAVLQARRERATRAREAGITP